MNKLLLSVVVLRNNLRIKDNPPLFFAQKNSENVLCLFPLEILEGYNFGFKACGVFRKEFIKQNLVELKHNLNEKNITLLCVKDLEKSLKSLENSFILKIYFEKEVGTYERQMELLLEKYKHFSYFNQTMCEPFSFDYKKSFSHFRKKAEKLEIKNELPNIRFQKNNLRNFSIDSETIISKDFNLIFNGGEKEANKRLNFYFNNHLHNYIETRSLFDGENISSEISPYLSVGAISAKTVYHRLKYYENKTYSSKSSYWIYFELLWRDFFHLVMFQSKNKLFLKSGLLNHEFNFREDSELLHNFFNANTKIDIIDAGIKQLISTGWLSNRTRQVLASYFIKNLGLDFRIAAAFFQKYLIDYNPASNYGNWAYLAGVGNDKNYRVFDPIQQSKKYGGSQYIKKYLNRREKGPKIDYKKMAQDVKKEVYGFYEFL